MKDKLKNRWDLPGDLINIGKISKISRIPVSTLRYYDQINLFKPAFIDNNLYRYYYTVQLYDLNFIESWKEQGFSLQEIKMIIDNDSPELLTEIYDKKEMEIKSKILKLKKSLKQIRTNSGIIKKYESGFKFENKHVVKEFEYENNKLYLKRNPSYYAVFINEKKDLTYENFTECYYKLKELIRKNRFKTDMPSHLKISFLDYEFGGTNNNKMEYSLKLISLPEFRSNFIKKYLIETVVSCYHFGSFLNIFEKYDLMKKFINERKMKFLGKISNILILHTHITIDENKFVTEIQMPVKNMEDIS